MYALVLSAPGMSEKVELKAKVSRKNVLLLVQVIGLGVAAMRADENGVTDQGQFEELEQLSTEYLVKADLVEFNEKLNSISKNK